MPVMYHVLKYSVVNTTICAWNQILFTKKLDYIHFTLYTEGVPGIAINSMGDKWFA